jgi:hypothetical protein
MAEFNVSVQITGVKEMFAILRTTDKRLLRMTQAAMRGAASPMVAQARVATPTGDAVLEGWRHSGRTGWRDAEVLGGISASVGGRSVRTNTWPLLKLTQKNAAGMIYDWAGRSGKGKRKDEHFVNYLPKLGATKGSQYSRVLFPSFVATRREVTGALLEALDKVAAEMNREIERIG